MEDKTFQSIKSKIENDYPLPLAQSFRKVRITKAENYGGKHKNLIDSFEVLVKFICILQLQELQQGIKNFTDYLPRKDKTLEFLKRPSLGGWIGLLRTLSNLDCNTEHLHWYDKIKKWYTQRGDSEAKRVLRRFDNIDNLNYNRKNKKTIAEICNAMVTYRNKQFGHGANFSPDELQIRNEVLETVLGYLYESAKFLSQLTLFHTKRLEITENDQWIVHALDLKGVNEEPIKLISDQKLLLSELYVCKSAEDSINAIVEMTPFIILSTNPKTKKEEVYYFNDAWRTKLEYLSYTSGDYYYHKELHNSFSHLLKIKLVPTEIEDKYFDMDSEEREKNAEELYKEALLKKSQEKYEESIILLEQAIEYKRKPKFFYLTSELMKCLNESELEIEHVIKEGDELAEKIKSYEKEETNQDDNKPTYSIIDVLTPQKFRKNSVLFCLVFIFIIGLISFLIENHYKLYGNQYRILVWYFLCSPIPIFLVLYEKYTLKKMRLILSLQTENVKLDRFDREYNKLKLLVLGNIRKENGRLKLYLNSSLEKFLYLLGLLFIVLGLLSHLYLTYSFQTSLILVIKRSLDCFILGIALLVSLRSLFTSIIFAFRYCKFSIKPIYIKKSTNGIKRIAYFLSTHLWIILILFLFFVLSFFVCDIRKVYLDIAFLVVFTGLVIVISIGFPFFLSKIAYESKNNLLLQYLKPLEKSFKEFIDNPANDNKLQKFRKIHKRLNEFNKINSFPYNFFEIIINIFLPNIILIFFVSIYIIDKYLMFWK